MDTLLKYTLIVFLLSLIPGDNFYLNINATQGYFLLPMLFFSVLNFKLIPKEQIQKVFGILFISILTIQLLIYNFKGLTEWYRTSGGVFLSFMIFALYAQYIDYAKQLKWLLSGILFVVAAFYLGFWVQTPGYDIRYTFLDHDPNHLAHLLIYGLILGIYLFNNNKDIVFKSKYRTIIILLFFFPVAFTLSRTSLIAFAAVVVLYVFILLEKVYRKYFIALSLFLIFSSSLILTLEIDFIQGFQMRFEQKDDDRKVFYNKAFEIATDNFLTGVGIANFLDEDWKKSQGFTRQVYDENRETVVEMATVSHNGFLDIFMIGGITLFLSFLVLVLYPPYYMLTLVSNDNNKYDKFLLYSFSLAFIIINLTYSLYNSKLGWYGIGYSYIVIYNYRTNHKFAHKFLFKK
jgi:O-antigen ligase